jgi:hypothetical protein
MFVVGFGTEETHTTWIWAFPRDGQEMRPGHHWFLIWSDPFGLRMTMRMGTEVRLMMGRSTWRRYSHRGPS